MSHPYLTDKGDKHHLLEEDMPDLPKWEEVKDLGFDKAMEMVNGLEKLFIEQFAEYFQLDLCVAYLYYLKGHLCRQIKGDMDQAAKYFEQCVDTKQDYAPGWFQLGFLREVEFLNFEGARTAYEKCLECDDEHIPAMHNLAKVLQTDVFEEYEDAEDLYKKVLEFEEGGKTAKHYTSYGTLFALQERKKEAIAQYTKAIELDNDWYNAHRNRANLAKEIGNYGMAAESFKRAVELEPEEIGNMYMLAETMKLLGNDEEADKYNKMAHEKDPDETSLYHYARVLESQGDLDGAIECYTRYIEHNPHDHTAARHNLAVLLMRHERDYEGAAKQFAACIEDNPDNISAVFNYGLLLKYHLKQYKPAKENFFKLTDSKLAEVDEKMDPLLKIQNAKIRLKSHNEMALLAEFQDEDFDEAKKWYNKALDMDIGFEPSEELEAELTHEYERSRAGITRLNDRKNFPDKAVVLRAPPVV